MSLGDVIMGLMSGGNPLQQFAGGQPGPQGNPPAAPGPGGGGAPAAPGGPPGGPQPQPQPQAYQSPPDMASMYMKLYQQDRSANEFDRGLATMLGGFKGPPGGAQALMNSVPPAQDPGALLQNIMQLRQGQFQQQSMMNAIPGLAKQLFGDNPTPDQIAQAQAIVASGKYGDVETNLVGGADLDQRQYQAAVRNGTFKGTYTDWRNQGAASGAATKATAEDYASEKANANTTFPDLDKQYATAESDAEWLADPAHKQAVTNAVKNWSVLTKGYTGEQAVKWGWVDQDTADARSYLDQLKDEQFTAGLRDTKNVRSQTEANKIGASMTAIDNPQNSPTLIQNEANRLKGIAQAARANLTAAAGRQVGYKYNGIVDPAYLDSTSPLYNGATMEKPDTTIKSPGDIGKLPKGRAYVVPPGFDEAGQVRYAPGPSS